MNEEKLSPEKKDQKGKDPQMKIVGYNLLAFVIYGLLLVAVLRDGEALVMFSFLFVFHFFFCIIAAVVQRKWAWVLSGVLIVIIGFSTCVSFLSV